MATNLFCMMCIQSWLINVCGPIKQFLVLASTTQLVSQRMWTST